jgi:hypothetical protein
MSCAQRNGLRGVLASDVADEIPRRFDYWSRCS